MYYLLGGDFLRINIDTTNLNKAIQQIQSYAENKANGIKEVIAESTMAIEGGAITRAPVSEIDGGNLKNSINSQFFDNGLTGEVSASAMYSMYVEFGTGIHATGDKPGRTTPWVYFDDKLKRFVFTRGMKPMPFMLPSWEEERPIYLKNLERELGKIK
jgi:HK97 gp10 family phage protein